MFIETVYLFLFLIWISQVTMGICLNKKSLNGKVALITGANTGIGRETALELARRKCKIYIACRRDAPNEPDPLETVRHIRKESGHDDVHFIELDLSSLESVREMVETFQEDHLDILIANAGITRGGKTERSMTKNGLEMVMAVNYFGHFLLTGLLLSKIRKVKGRIIVLSSIANLWGFLDESDPNYEKPGSFPKKGYLSSAVYARSKLCLTMFAKELGEREQDVLVASVHPGIVNTTLLDESPFIFALVFRILITYPFGKNVWQGAQTTLHLATLETFRSGRHFADCRESSLVKWRQINDPEARKTLWSVTSSLVKSSD